MNAVPVWIALIDAGICEKTVWGRIHVRRWQHAHVKLKKVKSRQSREMFVEQFGSDNLLHWFGNQKADSHATERAAAFAHRANPQHVYMD